MKIYVILKYMNKKIKLVIIIKLCYIEVFLLNIKISCMYTIEK